MERIDIRYALTEVTRDKRFVESLQWRSGEIFCAQENLAACVLVTAVENVSIQFVFWSLGPLSKTCLLQKRLPLSNGHFPRTRTLKKKHFYSDLTSTSKTVVMNTDDIYSTLLVITPILQFQNTFLPAIIPTIICFWFLLKNFKMGVILSGKHVKPTLSIKQRASGHQ